MIAIKGKDLPKSCSQCHLCIEDKNADMTCVLLCEEWEESDYNENHRDKKCPLVEVKTIKKILEYLAYIIAFIVGWIIGDLIYSIL